MLQARLFSDYWHCTSIAYYYLAQFHIMHIFFNKVHNCLIEYQPNFKDVHLKSFKYNNSSYLLCIVVMRQSSLKLCWGSVKPQWQGSNKSFKCDELYKKKYSSMTKINWCIISIGWLSLNFFFFCKLILSFAIIHFMHVIIIIFLTLWAASPEWSRICTF